ncbi:MAG: MFS transporter [SAR202 cluster bacterium]|nr:MFS transporter [SAR202 cluster bacterium]
MITGLANVSRFLRDFALGRSYWGYYVVAALFIAEIAVTGISFYSFSLYIRAWQNDPEFQFTTSQVAFQFSANPLDLMRAIGIYVVDLSQSWSLTAINFAFVVTLVVVPFTPFMGRVIDLRGARIVMLVSVPLIAASLFFRAFMTEVWHLWILQILLAFGQSGAFLGTGRLVGLWFQTNRGFMMGLTLAGNNAGGMLMAPLSAYLLTIMGWRSLFFIFGISLFVINFIVIYFFVKDQPEDVAVEARKAGRLEELAAVESEILGQNSASAGAADDERLPSHGAIDQGWDWKDAVKSKVFWLIAMGQTAAFISIFAILNQLAKHLEIIGINLAVAGFALGLLGFFGLFGKLIFGWLSEKFPVRYVFAFCLVLQIIGIFILFLVTSDARVWILIPFVALYGLGFGAMGALQPLIVLNTFGILSYATILGVMQVLLRVANALAPVAVGASVDSSGSYNTVFIATIVFLVFGTVCVALAKPPKPVQSD